jgi:hypothetical protein
VDIALAFNRRKCASGTNLMGESFHQMKVRTVLEEIIVGWNIFSLGSECHHLGVADSPAKITIPCSYSKLVTAIVMGVI